MQIYKRIRAKAARTRIRVPRVWWWHVGVKPQDAFLACVPRSGSTWLRFMLSQVITGEDPGFRRIEGLIPEIESQRGVPPILPSGGRFIKTHERYRSDYKKAVYLVRDVRDVILSSWARAVEVGLAPFVCKGDFDSFLLSYLQGKVLATGSWQGHVRSWLTSPVAESGNLIVVRYEELRKDPEQGLRQVLEFLGVTPNIPLIRTAIENNTLQQMRAKEDRAKKAGEFSILLGSHKSAQEDGRFVRKGAVGGWRNQFTAEQAELVLQYAGEGLANLGYEAGFAGKTEPRSALVSSLRT